MTAIVKNIALLAFSALLLVTGCRKTQTLSFKDSSTDQLIGLIALDNFDSSKIKKIASGISELTHKPTVILQGRILSPTFFNVNAGKYSADSILDMLTILRPDSITELIGLTSQSIFSGNNTDKNHRHREWIFGLGDHPGNVCVVSDAAFKTNIASLYFNRAQKVILHEMGHNMGLDHCSNDTCIMSGQNGSLQKLDKNKSQYCAACLRKIN